MNWLFSTELLPKNFFFQKSLKIAQISEKVGKVSVQRLRTLTWSVQNWLLVMFLSFYSRDDSPVFEKSKFSEGTTPLSDKPVYAQNY